MTLSVLMNTSEVYQELIDGQIDKVNHIIDMLEDFDNEIILDEDNISEVYQEIYSRSFLYTLNRPGN